MDVLFMYNIYEYTSYYRSYRIDRNYETTINSRGATNKSEAWHVIISRGNIVNRILFLYIIIRSINKYFSCINRYNENVYLIQRNPINTLPRFRSKKMIAERLLNKKNNKFYTSEVLY